MSISLNQGANNVTMDHVYISNAHYGTHNSLEGLDLLRRHCAFDALLNSKDRFDPPRCDKGTRQIIIRKIMDWITSDESSASMMVLHGSAGVGKSALEQTISEECSKVRLLAASFFFSRTVPSRSNGDNLIPTLVHQLSKVIPGFTEQIVEVLKNDPDLFKLSRGTQMEQLILDPIIRLQQRRPDSWIKRWARRATFKSQTRSRTSATWPRFIAIDGLDECAETATQCDLLITLASTLLKLPYPFRLLIASRPESHIMEVLNHHPSLQSNLIHRLDLGTDADADADIRTFFYDRFNKIKRTHHIGQHLDGSWVTREDVDTLVRKASSHFIYAAVVMNFIGSSKHRPDDRLRVVLGLAPARENERPFLQLDALYTHIFSCIKTEDLAIVLRILGILELPMIKERYGIPTPMFFEQVFEFRPGCIELALDELASIVTIPSRDAGLPIKVLHASLSDFLLDPYRSGIYALDHSLTHETLAEWQWKQINRLGSNLDEKNEAMKNFLYHCKSARTSDEIMDHLHESAQLLGQLVCENFDALDSQRVDQNLRRLGVVLGREDFPHGPRALRIVSAFRASWPPRGMELPQWPHLFVALRARLTAFNETEDNDLESMKRRVHNALYLARFMHCAHWLYQKPKSFSLAAVASSCVFSVFKSHSQESGWVASDAAVLLFVSTLLRYCLPDNLSAHIVQLLPTDLGQRVRLTSSEEVFKADYRKEAQAYLQRVRNIVGPQAAENFDQLNDANEGVGKGSS